MAGQQTNNETDNTIPQKEFMHNHNPDDSNPFNLSPEKIALLESRIEEILLEDILRDIKKQRELLAFARNRLEKIKNTLFILSDK